MVALPVTVLRLGEEGGLIYGLVVEGGDFLGLVVFEDGEVGGFEVLDDGAGFFVADDDVGEDDVGVDAEGVGGLLGGLLGVGGERQCNEQEQRQRQKQIPFGNDKQRGKSDSQCNCETQRLNWGKNGGPSLRDDVSFCWCRHFLEAHVLRSGSGRGG